MKLCRLKPRLGIPGFGPRKKFRKLQAWLGLTSLSCDLHSRPLTKYFPPLEAATAADLAQAFEPVLRRLRQQPPPQEKV